MTNGIGDREHMSLLAVLQRFHKRIGSVCKISLLVILAIVNHTLRCGVTDGNG